MSKPIISVKLSDIRDNPIALRGVDKQGEKYGGLVDSIREKGFMGCITVREKKDPVTGATYYEIVDGLHRTTASRDAGLSEIPAQVLDINEADTLEAQFMMNFHKVETRPVEYSKQMHRMLMQNPAWTEADMAKRLGISAQVVKDRLNLVKLPEKIAALVDDGSITLQKAINLAKLPPEEMNDWVDKAITMNGAEFIPLVASRIKEISDSKRAGKAAAPAEFVANPHLQKISDIKAAIDTPAVAKRLTKGITTPVEAFQMGCMWVLHMDEASIAEGKAKWEQAKLDREKKAEERRAEREKLKAEKAASAAAEVASATK